MSSSPDPSVCVSPDGNSTIATGETSGSTDKPKPSVPVGNFTEAIHCFNKEQEKVGDELEQSLAVLVDNVFSLGVAYESSKV